MPVPHEQKEFPVAQMAETLIGSEIIKLAWEVHDLIRNGASILNFTIGDFDPKLFPIPEKLREGIQAALADHQTNYPPANGMPELRQAVSQFLQQQIGLTYTPEEILITSGGRPAIYGIYRTLLDPGDAVVFPVPSWNNNHYCHLCGARPIAVESRPENHFMPTADELSPYLSEASLLALCSPQNPTGTVFTAEGLRTIARLVAEENARRHGRRKPLYVLYDQMYWALTFGTARHHDPVTLMPELRPYTLFVDGISKVFAATGLRVGWAMGPVHIIEKMKSISSHIGAWAPKPEQLATAELLRDASMVDAFLTQFKQQIAHRLNSIYDGLMQLNREGFPVDAIAPKAALYLTVYINAKGKRMPNGQIIRNTTDTTHYLLHDCGIALVPFYAFGASPESCWYRLSVGTCKPDEIDLFLQRLRKGLQELH